MCIIELEETVSTNDDLKPYLSGGKDMIVVARRQTGGRGTKGRSFLSDEGGVYLSALTFYDCLPADRAFEIMAHAATAVCKTAEEFGAHPWIKWPNDVYADGRKLCGILIENTLSGGHVRASIVGIGLNVENDVSSLGGIAVNLRQLTEKKLSVDTVRSALIRNLRTPTSFGDYLSRVGGLGREITVIEGAASYRATARSVLPDGRLEVDAADGKKLLSAAEITIRL